MCPRRPSVPCLEEGQRLRGPLGRSRFVLGSWEKGLRFRAFTGVLACKPAAKGALGGKRLRVARLLPGFKRSFSFRASGFLAGFPGLLQGWFRVLPV